MANNANNNGKNLRHCSFCGRNEHQVNFLIPSPTNAYICDFCVEACYDLIADEKDLLSGNSQDSVVELDPAKLRAVDLDAVLAPAEDKKNAD